MCDRTCEVSVRWLLLLCCVAFSDNAITDIWSIQAPAYINGGASEWAALEHMLQCARLLVVQGSLIIAAEQTGGDLAIATWLKRPMAHGTEVAAQTLAAARWMHCR